MKEKVIVIDIESTGLELTSRLHVMSFGYFKGGQWHIESTNDLDVIAGYFSNPNNIIVGHNFFNFDLHVVKHNIEVPIINCKIIDTLYMSQYIYPDKLIHGLEEWGTYFGVPKVAVDDSEWKGVPDRDLAILEEYMTKWKTHDFPPGHKEVCKAIYDFKLSHYERMRERCEVDVKINIALWDKLYDDITELYEWDADAVERVITALSFKGELAHIQQNNRVHVDIDFTKESLATLTEIFERKKIRLEEIMPRPPKFSTKSKPKNLYKADGSLSKKAEEWYQFLKDHGLDMDNELPVKYVNGSIDANGSSGDQQKELLYSLGWEPITFNKGSNGDVAQLRVDGEDGKELCPSVLKIVNEYKDKLPQLEELNEMSVLKHRLGVLKGFLNPAHLDENNTVCASWSGITKTWRVKHKAPIVNLPKNGGKFGEYIRRCLIAPKGYLWVNADLSSLEDKTKQCCIIDLDPDYVAKLNIKGYDAHLTIGELAGFFDADDIAFFKWYKSKNRDIKDCPERFKDNVDEFDEMFEKLSSIRGKAKTVNYACTYGAGAAKIAATADCSMEEAELLVQTYWKLNWAVKEFANGCKTKKFKGMNWIWSRFSRRWLKFDSEHMKFSAVNQNFGATIFDIWVYFLLQEGIQIIMSIHDEVSFYIKDTPEDQLRAEQAVQRAITRVNNAFKQPITFEAEPEFADSYGNVH